MRFLGIYLNCNLAITNFAFRPCIFGNSDACKILFVKSNHHLSSQILKLYSMSHQTKPKNSIFKTLFTSITIIKLANAYKFSLLF